MVDEDEDEDLVVVEEAKDKTRSSCTRPYPALFVGASPSGVTEGTPPVS